MRAGHVRYHRNGMSGEPFYTVTWTETLAWADDERPHPRRMLGIVHDEPGSVSVIDLDDPHLTWRGDRWEAWLRTTVRTADENLTAYDR